VTSYDPGGVLPNVEAVCAEVVAAFPAITHVWGAGPDPDHNNLRCIDYMVPSLDDGDLVAQYNVDNHDRLGVNLIIWDHEIWRSYPKNEYPPYTWAPYSGTSNPHTDHNHVEYLEQAYVGPDGHQGPVPWEETRGCR
jgi:hypothetical protein